MEKKGFIIGSIVASCVWIAAVTCIAYLNEPVPVRCEDALMHTHVKAYEQGYYECLQDTRPDIYSAYLYCNAELKKVKGDSAFESIVDTECAMHNLSDVDKEYLCTLLLD